ncbi:LysM peptidoglycan-binding domain-containing protein [Micromonospora psammae]|uniref:LysM peptidoglycan-binding domain-containing protein n=1 Tax=Micromonospora sp. CPCC 205556 TaxID=3122398 RepID=UPI002FEE9A6E
MTTPRGSAARRAGQLLTGFGSLVVLVALLAGAPVALLAFAGNPLPDQLPTLAEVGTALTSRDDGQLFLRALAVVGWVGWATFTFSVLVELGAQAARRPAPRLPGMRRQQRAAAALVGSVALILAVSPAASAAAAVTQPAPASAVAVTQPAPASAAAMTQPAAASAAVTTQAAPAGAAAQTAQPAPALPGAATTAGTGRPQPTAAPPVYRVAKGDHLGEVAERYLDDFDRYRDVAKLNRLRDADEIRPGQLLKLPPQARDGGAREHAAGRLVIRPETPRKPSPHPRTVTPTTPGKAPAGPATPGKAGPSTPGKAGPADVGQQPAPQTVKPQVERPAGQSPAMSAGAARAGGEDGMNRPLAVSAVLAVASIVGAQIGAVLGLRRRPARVTAARALVTGRHRRD